MIKSVLFALISVVVTISFGYYAAKKGGFTDHDNDVLVKLIMRYALPMSVFAGIWSTPRKILVKDVPLGLWLLGTMAGCYLVCYLVYRFLFHAPIGESTLYTLSIADPSVPFIGSALLPFIFSIQISAVIIGICVLINNLITMPISISLLNNSKHQESVGSKILDTLRKPLVFSSFGGFIMSLSGYQMPKVIGPIFTNLGKAAGGLAMFSIGIVLCTKKVVFNRQIISTIFSKNVLFPGIILLIMIFLHSPSSLIKMVVLILAIPTATLPTTLAIRFKTDESQVASIQFGSTVASFVTLFLFMTLI